MKKGELIIKTAPRDWGMVQWAQASNIGSDAPSLNPLDESLRLLILGDGILSDDAIFQGLMKKKRLKSDVYEVNHRLSVSKDRSKEELLNLFSVDDESVYKEFMFRCERRRYFLIFCKKLVTQVRDILYAYDRTAPDGDELDRVERELHEQADKVVELCINGIDQVGRLVSEYHAHPNIIRDEAYNDWKIPKDTHIGFKDCLLFNFENLNKPDTASFRHGDMTIDDSIAYFFITITSNLAKCTYFNKLLNGEVPAGFKGESLTKKQSEFIRAFAFLD